MKFEASEQSVTQFPLKVQDITRPAAQRGLSEVVIEFYLS